MTTSTKVLTNVKVRKDTELLKAVKKNQIKNAIRLASKGIFLF